MLQEIARAFVTTFDTIFISLFGVEPLSFSGMNIMIVFTTVCGAVMVYSNYRLSRLHRRRRD